MKKAVKVFEVGGVQKAPMETWLPEGCVGDGMGRAISREGTKVASQETTDEDLVPESSADVPCPSNLYNSQVSIRVGC